ncbi:hypothetical protein AJ79_05865 [Helicocarpus griseus UAMH5409]|uniref:chitinase n=1 Tax=Helicocarpus griseus UAMH5409 TaxID=1447875 RepID=A0A2B7XI07_9EURO|nr:hypothetical protein AJ79_05865 [Helicocarpus griseus UAMH5409]
MKHQCLALLAVFGWFSSAQAIIETSAGQYPDLCPGKCSHLGPNPAGWTRVHRFNHVARCDEPILFDFNVQNVNSDPRTHNTIRACSRSDEDVPEPVRVRDDPEIAFTASLSAHDDCGAKARQDKKTAQMMGASAQTSAAVNASDVLQATSHLASYLQHESSCGPLIMFAKSGGAVVGLYSGAEVQKASAARLIKTFQEQVQSGNQLLQVCDKGSTAARTLGVIAAGVVDLARIHDAIKSWTNSECVETQGLPNPLEVEIDFLVSSVAAEDVSNTTKKSLHSRAECKAIQVVPGDSCASLASRCGITGLEFERHNPNPNLCSTLMPKQWVCCTPGDLPDYRPQPGADGSCYIYTVQPGDGCWAIADSFGISQTVIENNNDDTWGWAGCDRLQAGQKICLSSGSPPFPPPIENAQCGPQVPGTAKPTNDTQWEGLNPCPLKSCCDVWGFCGVTEEFCTPTPADTGAPGTAKPGTNGCISNCGTDIVNKDDPPKTFRRVGYFQAWNANRPCLHMDVTEIDTTELTHIHFAFATVTEDFKVTIAGVQEQFDKYVSMSTKAKKILSFGGWAFSTEPETFQRFRNATKPENREAFATNCASFMNDNNLDGLDFDWEYPGAPDIPNIPPGSRDEGHNYLEFLKLMREKMRGGGELAIALPASFWYLRPYPVHEIEPVVDYFVYMTYDLHGQWDAGNKWTSPGCPKGNCLRSHINLTETVTALSMITKAGVPANKVLIGITSYGRSFRMSDPTCADPKCTFTGTRNSSNAHRGRCTGTSGYISNFELKEIIAGERGYSLVNSYRDANSDSDILIYGSDKEADWVAYMNEVTRGSRVNFYKGMNFGGATDWAVDLMGVEKCNPDDRTYRDEIMPEGKHMPWYLMNPEYAAVSGKRYITIVNLTPHRFEFYYNHSYQIKFDWGDIPPGHARQNTADYDSVWSPKDSNGEAYYRIEGTDKKFMVRATTHIPDIYPKRTVFDLSRIGHGQREYKDPEQESSVTLVITGSNEYGFITSLTHGPGGWMRKLYDVIRNRKLKQIVMPGTHNSGMSRISEQIDGFEPPPGTTQTQALNIYDQLRAGARWLDLRVGTVHPIGNEDEYSFWTMHVNGELLEVSMGDTGESLDEVIEEINKFTDENPGEVIFFWVGYLVGIRSTPSYGPIMWDRNIINDFFNRLKRVNNRCGNLDTVKEFGEQTMSYFMDRNSGKGCVIFLLNGHLKDSDQLVSEGIYNRRVMKRSERWSEAATTEYLVEDQIQAWKDISRVQENGIFHALSRYWNMVENLAVKPTNPTLYWAGVNGMGIDTWPNVIMVDYIGVVVKGEAAWNQLSAELYTLAIGLNLYLISESCHVNDRRSPLLGPSTSSMANRFPTPRNSIIFANGTVLDSPPVGFHLGRVETLKNGTVLGNGTVLDRDIPNPDFNMP